MAEHEIDLAAYILVVLSTRRNFTTKQHYPFVGKSQSTYHENRKIQRYRIGDGPLLSNTKKTIKNPSIKKRIKHKDYICNHCKTSDTPQWRRKLINNGFVRLCNRCFLADKAKQHIVTKNRK